MLKFFKLGKNTQTKKKMSVRRLGNTISNCQIYLVNFCNSFVRLTPKNADANLIKILNIINVSNFKNTKDTILHVLRHYSP